MNSSVEGLNLEEVEKSQVQNNKMSSYIVQSIWIAHRKTESIHWCLLWIYLLWDATQQDLHIGSRPEDTNLSGFHARYHRENRRFRQQSSRRS